MFPFNWVFLFQNVSYFVDSPRIYHDVQLHVNVINQN